MSTRHTSAGSPELAASYDEVGNFVSPEPGAEPYSPAQYWKMEAVKYFERLSDILIWLIPIAGLLFAAHQLYGAAMASYAASATSRR